MSEQAEQLYQEAMMAVDGGNPKRAADLLKETVENDPEMVAAWVELAKLLEDKDEKRIALTTILQLDPQNEYAKNELAETEKPATVKKDEEEIVPGITRREARLVAIGLTVFTLVVCGIVFAITSAANSQRAAKAQIATQGVLDQTATWDAVNANNTQVAVMAITSTADAMATFLAENSPTPTVTITRAFVLPTEIPDTPTPTEVSFRGDLPLPPAAIGGRIFAWGGRTVRSDEFLEFRVYSPANQGRADRVNADLAQFPSADVAGQSAVYMQYLPDGWTIYRIDLNNPTAGGTLVSTVLAQGGARFAARPRLSADGTKLVVVGTSAENTSAVFMVDFTANTAVRLTKDAANYTSAGISPNGNQVVAVRDDGTATDLVLIDVTRPDYPQTPLTADGNSLVEANPVFAPDGQQVAYSVSTPDRPDQSDLYVLRLSGNQSTGSLPIMTLDGDDIYPVFNPTSQYVAFASNRVGGVYNLYIYDMTTRQTYQLTADADPVFPGSWSN